MRTPPTIATRLLAVAPGLSRLTAGSASAAENGDHPVATAAMGRL